MKTQKQIVLSLLKNWTSALDCFKKGGGMRLAAHIHALKYDGYDIESKWHVTGDFKIYRLKPSKK
jgi:biotin operon repressor